ncbi:hypothetical protein [Pseudarthrobacter sp. PS3-L1]|uniref:hypothetical protein n=1 Tax=Pseudarthrobacter sp. PS3-L1 TaxID=3046207 RepID=UPI0024B9B54F|nr:hypothetical protein [Pseudarthrobacter sp. PS3-L1]MDJ0321655.1 hypothetical protein [Pseudarthrobacter sp. PS3-L1]
MSDEISMRIGSVQFHGRPGLGPFVVAKDGLDGWSDSVALRGEDVARQGAPGSYVLRRYSGTRTATLTGFILPKSRDEGEALATRLTGLGAGVDPVRVYVSKGGVTLWADAFVELVNVDERHGSVVRDVQIQLLCPDPRKYGGDNSFTIPSSVSTSVYHRGNAPAFPKFIVAGSMPGGYTITVGGSQFKVTVPLVSGVSHGITFSDGRLRIRGAVVHGGVGTAETLGIAAGTIPTVFLEPVTTGSGTAFLTLTDTFI